MSEMGYNILHVPHGMCYSMHYNVSHSFTFLYFGYFIYSFKSVGKDGQQLSTLRPAKFWSHLSSDVIPTILTGTNACNRVCTPELASFTSWCTAYAALFLWTWWMFSEGFQNKLVLIKHKNNIKASAQNKTSDDPIQFNIVRSRLAVKWHPHSIKTDQRLLSVKRTHFRGKHWPPPSYIFCSGYHTKHLYQVEFHGEMVLFHVITNKQRFGAVPHHGLSKIYSDAALFYILAA